MSEVKAEIKKNKVKTKSKKSTEAMDRIMDEVTRLVMAKYPSASLEDDTITVYWGDFAWEAHVYFPTEYLGFGRYSALAHSLDERFNDKHLVHVDLDVDPDEKNVYEIAWKILAFLDELTKWAGVFGLKDTRPKLKAA